MNIKSDGYFIIRSFFNKKDLLDIESNVKATFCSMNRVSEEDLELTIAHRRVAENKVKYLSMGYETPEINSSIKSLVNNKLTSFLSEKINKNVVYEEGGSVITLFPTKFTGYKVEYHQDEAVADKEPNRIHAITPLSRNPLNLIRVLKGTHVEGVFNHTSFGPLIRIEDVRLKMYEDNVDKITLNYGDILLFYTSLVHKVEDNLDVNNTHWIMRFIYKHNKKGSQNDSRT